MKSVIDHRLSASPFMIVIDDRAQRLPSYLHRKRDNGGVTAAGRGNRARTEVVSRGTSLPGLLIHVAVTIDAARHDEFPPGIDCFLSSRQVIAQQRYAAITHSDIA